MTKLQWLFGLRYELSRDGAGLLKYISPADYYHVHSTELTSLEQRKKRVLKKLKKSEVRFST